MTDIELAKILDRAGFFSTTRDWEKLKVWKNENNHLISQYHLTFPSGCTKQCVVSYFYHIVLKFDFYLGSNNTGYEEEYYNKAKEKHLERYFAETKYIGTFSNYKVYSQEYCDIDEDAIVDLFYEYCMRVATYTRDEFKEESLYEDAIHDLVYDMDDYDRLKAIFSEDADKMIDFIHEFGINDLHEGNFGFNSKTNAPIIIDYCGY